MLNGLEEKLLKKAKEEKISRYVVGGVLGNGKNVLLLKRPENEFMGGIYELPSGKVEPGESLYTALRREVKEETALKTKGITKYLGSFDYDSKNGEKTRQFNFAIVAYPPLKIELQEHENYVWIDKDQLENYPVTDSVKFVLSLFWEESGP